MASQEATDATHIDVDVEDLKPEAVEEPKTPSIFYQMMAEALGTMFIVVVGVNAVHGAVLAQGAAGNFQVGMMFALGIMWGVYTAGNISGGHLNPAITFAVALLRPSSFPIWKVPCYWVAQVLGAFFGGAMNYGLWRPVIATFENNNGIDRGTPESDITASLGFGVFPFPAAAAANKWPADVVSPGQAVLVEAFGAAVLCFVVFMILDSRNKTLGNKDIAPFIIALSIGAMISIISPLTTGCFNPARDFGPRIIGAMAGWGSRAFPGKDSGFWVYIIGPCLGAPIGGALYDFLYSRAYTGKMF